jgi:hypothetical protein
MVPRSEPDASALNQHPKILHNQLMKKREKLVLTTMPHAVHLFFKFCKFLTEVKWQLKFPDDEILGAPSKRESISKEGRIRLYRSPDYLRKWIGAPPFQTTYHDGKQHHIIFPREAFWELPEIKPCKAERDAWHAQQKEKSLQREVLEERQEFAPIAQPAPKPTITIKVTPRQDSNSYTTSE